MKRTAFALLSVAVSHRTCASVTSTSHRPMPPAVKSGRAIMARPRAYECASNRQYSQKLRRMSTETVFSSLISQKRGKTKSFKRSSGHYRGRVSPVIVSSPKALERSRSDRPAKPLQLLTALKKRFRLKKLTDVAPLVHLKRSPNGHAQGDPFRAVLPGQRQTPEPRGLVCTPRQNVLTVRAKGHTMHHISMRERRTDGSPASRLPQSRRAVPTPRQDVVAVGTKGHARKHSPVFERLADGLAPRRFPICAFMSSPAIST